MIGLDTGFSWSSFWVTRRLSLCGGNLWTEQRRVPSLACPCSKSNGWDSVERSLITRPFLTGSLPCAMCIGYTIQKSSRLRRA